MRLKCIWHGGQCFIAKNSCVDFEFRVANIERDDYLFHRNKTVYSYLAIGWKKAFLYPSAPRLANVTENTPSNH